jgi:phosphohistidine phosphatase SixA
VSALLLVRHASAGNRDEWQRDDRERPLDERGRARAQQLVEELAPYRIDAILTSPYRRCVETVEPLATARGLEPEARAELGEELQQTAGIALVRTFAGSDVVVCGHGGLESALVDPPRWRKGAVFVVDENLRVLDAF